MKLANVIIYTLPDGTQRATQNQSKLADTLGWTEQEMNYRMQKKENKYDDRIEFIFRYTNIKKFEV